MTFLSEDKSAISLGLRRSKHCYVNHASSPIFDENYNGFNMFFSVSATTCGLNFVLKYLEQGRIKA